MAMRRTSRMVGVARVGLLVSICLLFAGYVRPSCSAEMILNEVDYLTPTRVQIFIVGKIDRGDDEKFKEILRPLLGKRAWVDRVTIFSNGGHATAAINIGRVIRQLNISTRAPSLPVNVPGKRI